MKLMYPAKLGTDTKCPYCKTRITPIGGGALFNCQSGHIVECVVMVSLNRTDVLQEKRVVEQPTMVQPRQHMQSNITTDEPILPPKPKTN